MKVKKFGKLIALISVVVCLLACTLFVGSARAYAEEIENNAVPEESVNPSQTPEDGEEDGKKDNGAGSIVDGFLAQLKEKYGDDYEYYYNAILDKWGSVENYLLSLVPEEAPDAAANGWKNFVEWLGIYSPIWASAFALVLVIAIIMFGKKTVNKISEWATSTVGKFKTIFTSINKMYAAHLAESKALLKLLGENEKFKEEREALVQATGEIEKDDEL